MMHPFMKAEGRIAGGFVADSERRRPFIGNDSARRGGEKAQKPVEKA
jgi:hypothetical protein